MARDMIADPLNVVERGELRKLVKRIKESSEQIVEDLCTIKTKRLFREHKSFKAFVEAELPFNRQRAYQLIQHVQMRENLSTAVDTLPASEWQSRPLAKLEPAQQIACWKDVLEETDGKPTTEAVEAKVEVYLADDDPYAPPLEDSTSEELPDVEPEMDELYQGEAAEDVDEDVNVIDTVASQVAALPADKRAELATKGCTAIGTLMRTLDDLNVEWHSLTLVEIRETLLEVGRRARAA